MATIRICIAALLLSLAGVGVAQSYQIDRYAENRPERGMTMQAVERGWGAPSTRRAAVGDPPITRWEYPAFTVYFEHDRVIHAVTNRRVSSS